MNVTPLTLGARISAEELSNFVSAGHSRPEDLEEGDLLHRLDKFSIYVLQAVPLSSIALDEWIVHDTLVADYAQRLAAGEQSPPVVYDADASSMIDGTHRANALRLSGSESILAWVGLPENINPDWREEPDEDVDDGIESGMDVEDSDSDASTDHRSFRP